MNFAKDIMNDNTVRDVIFTWSGQYLVVHCFFNQKDILFQCLS